MAAQISDAQMRSGPDIGATAGDSLPVTPAREPDAIPLRAQVGIGGVAVAAAVLSFSSLRELAISTGTWSWIAFLLPVSLDAAAGVSMFVWMRSSTKHVIGYARGLTWASILVSIICNGANHGFAASTVIPPWQAAVAVGAIPPIMFGAVIHLAFLTRQPERWGGPDTVTPPAPPVVAAPLEIEPVVDPEPETVEVEPEPLPEPVTAEVEPEPEPEPVRDETPPVKPSRRRCQSHACGKLLPPGSRTDRRFCDATCRQAASRAARNASAVTA